MLDWLIIGGGIHGSYLARVLMDANGLDTGTMRILDDAPSPLAAWDRRTGACGMQYLRSPQAHHLGRRGDSLRRYAQYRGDSGFIAPYQRPALSLFRAHTADVLAARRIEQLRLIGRAHQIVSQRDKGYWVATDTGPLRAQNIVLAPGPPAPARPEWAQGIAHVFEPRFRARDYTAQHVAIIGAGASAGHLALTLAACGAAVTLVATRGPRQADFDSDPCYLGPRCLATFSRGTPLARRRAITTARRPGTLPRDVYRAVTDHAGIRMVTGTVTGLADNGVQLAGGQRVRADQCVLATGFANTRPGGRLVNDAVARMALPVAGCGWPLLATDLQWRPGLYVSAGLAELELGPAAGNIAGARMAGRRLLAAQRYTQHETTTV